MYPQEDSSATPGMSPEPSLASNPAWRRNPMDSRGLQEVNPGALVIAGTAGGGGGDVSGEVYQLCAVLYCTAVPTLWHRSESRTDPYYS